MTKKSTNRALFALLSVAVTVVPLAVLAAYGQTMSISIPGLHAASKERVVGFEIHVKSGRIAQLPNVPIGWNVSVDNDASWNTVIKGTSMVGAAAVDPRFFRGFLVVEKNESLGIPFDLEGEVIVTEDFTTERRIKVGIEDLVLKSVAAKAPRTK
jgi:hypothetical protein